MLLNVTSEKLDSFSPFFLWCGSFMVYAQKTSKDTWIVCKCLYENLY